MQALIRRPNAPWIFLFMAIAGSAIFGVAIGVFMGPPSVIIGERLPEFTCLQVAFTADRFQSVFLSFPEAARLAYADILVPGDLIFAWGYGFQLAGLMGLLVIRLPGEWQRVGAWMFWAPLLASTLDCVEDVFLFALAQQLIADPASDIGALFPLLGGLAATVKYLALTVITPAFGLAGIVKGLSVDRSIGAWCLYVVFGLLLVMMVLRPLQQIPPCF